MFLPADQSQAWASGRYLDGMMIAFFLVGVVVLLRARMRDILGFAAVAFRSRSFFSGRR